MKNLHQLLLLLFGFCFYFATAQNSNIDGLVGSIQNIDSNVEFTNKNEFLSTPGFSSILIVGIADMNADGLDDIIRLEEAKLLSIEYQLGNNHFQTYTYGNIANGQQWNIAVADVDQNGFNDIMVGGLQDGMKLFKANNTGIGFVESLLPNSYFFSQGSNFSDINNDGFADAFICNDNGENRIWGNDGNGNFFTADDWIDMSTIPTSDNSGNYASVWTDFDNDGDLDLYVSKCRTGVNDPTDPRRINQLFENTNGAFNEVAAIHGLASGSQSWTTDFQDIDNDGDLDCFVLNHDALCQLFENDGNGFFTDITTESGLEITTNHLQGILRDFNNDGLVDILVAGNEGYEYFENNGNQTFSKLNGLFGDYLMSTFAVGDLNVDGFLDVYSGSLTSEDILWISEPNNNHFFAANLVGTSSNINALGARLELYGSWGVQLREIRSGESYGIMNSYTQFFGLGTEESIDSLVVKWPSGVKEVFETPSIDQFLTVIENDCAYPGKNIFTGGVNKFCTGDELLLKAPAGETYLWSNGAETQELLIDEGGWYSVTVTNQNACSTVSNPIFITQDPDETPTVSIVGSPTFCFGNSVFLSSSTAESYLWSSGQTSQNIPVFESGEYSVTVPGFCGAYTSDPVLISVIDIPDDPMVENDTITAVPGVGFLTATGENLFWFDDPFAIDEIGIGNEFETPLLTETTAFYVESVNELDGVRCKSDRIEVLVVIDTITAINLLDGVDKIHVYPNPANEKMIVEFEKGISSSGIIRLIDLTGKTIFLASIESSNSSTKRQLNLGKIPTGVYLLTFVSDELFYHQKMVIQKD